MQQILKNEATAGRRRVPIYLVDLTDGFTPETGITSPTINITKNGGSPAAGTGTFTEIGGGLYYYEFAASEVDTEGFLTVQLYKATVSRECIVTVQVTVQDQYTTIPTVAEIADGVLEELVGDHLGTSGSTAQYLANANIIFEEIIPETLIIETLGSNLLQVGVRCFDMTGIRSFASGDVIALGGILIARLRAGVSTIIYLGAPDVVDSGNGVILKRDVDPVDFQPGDIMYIELTGVIISVGGFSYYPPSFKESVNILGNDLLIEQLLPRIAGLVHENIWVSNTYVAGQHVSSVMELYDTKANATAHDGVTGLIAKYDLTVTYNPQNKITNHLMTRDGS